MKNLPSVLLAALLAAGCATEAPIPKTFPLSSQHKLKSAHHWDVIARDVAQQVASGLVKHNLTNTPVVVASHQPSATFEKGFRNFLITHLVDLNQPVAQRQAEVEVQIETQIVRHASNRRVSIPGELTVLTAGIIVVRQAALRWDSDEVKAGALALAGLADWGKGHATSATKTEVIVTTSLMRKGQYLMRKTDVYYVEDEDGALYEQMKEWRVVG